MSDNENRTASHLSVLHLSTYDIGGGAIRAAFRLHDSLRHSGVSSQMLVKRKFGDDPDIVEGRRPLGKAEWLWRRLAFYLDSMPLRLMQTANKSGLSLAWTPERVLHHVSGLPGDIINLHWICEGFMRPETIRRLNRPLVWTCYDTWGFCGAEHYGGDCARAIEGYTRANRPPDESGLDLNRWVWNRKRKAWGDVDMTIVAATRWQADLMARSILFRNRRIEIIPHGVDLQRFKPVDRNFARQVLDLPLDKKLILFGAMGGLSNERKGGHLLLEALKKLAARGFAKDTELVTFGSAPPAEALNLGLPVKFLGKMDEYGLVLAYAATDTFVAPSLEDNLPLTVLEAMACARPVVAFDIGGMVDVVQHRENGWLAQSFSTEQLAEGLAWVLNDVDRRQSLGDSARRKVESGFGLQHQASGYRDLYRDIQKTAQ